MQNSNPLVEVRRGVWVRLSQAWKWAALVLLIALPAQAAECGPATWTNGTADTVTVAVQLGEGYEEVAVAPGDTVEYWEAAPGSAWAVWDLDGTVLASGAQCGEPVVVEDPVEDYDPVLNAPAPVAEPYRPAGVEIV